MCGSCLNAEGLTVLQLALTLLQDLLSSLQRVLLYLLCLEAEGWPQSLY